MIEDVKDAEIVSNADLTEYTTMKLKSHGNLIRVKSIDALSQILKQMKSFI